MDHNFESHLLGTTEQNRALQPVGFSPFSTGKKGFKKPIGTWNRITVTQGRGREREEGRKKGGASWLACWKPVFNFLFWPTLACGLSFLLSLSWQRYEVSFVCGKLKRNIVGRRKNHFPPLCVHFAILQTSLLSLRRVFQTFVF